MCIQILFLRRDDKTNKNNISLNFNFIQIRLSTTWNVDDVYRMPVGIRTIKWTNTSFLINDKPAYLRGFGRHEDSDVNIVTFYRAARSLSETGNSNRNCYC